MGQNFYLAPYLFLILIDFGPSPSFSFWRPISEFIPLLSWTYSMYMCLTTQILTSGSPALNNCQSLLLNLIQGPDSKFENTDFLMDLKCKSWKIIQKTTR